MVEKMSVYCAALLRSRPPPPPLCRQSKKLRYRRGISHRKAQEPGAHSGTGHALGDSLVTGQPNGERKVHLLCAACTRKRASTMVPSLAHPRLQTDEGHEETALNCKMPKANFIGMLGFFPI